MIDFRYHLVSLIAVFLALALGILLGAGPLNRPLGDQLTGQVEDLREDRDRLRNELEASQADQQQRDDFLDAVAPEALGSRLEGRSIAIISLPEADTEDVEDIGQRLEQAGAEVTAEVQITPDWSDPEAANFRSSFSGQLTSYLSPEPDEEDPTDVILGTALGQGLTRGDEEEGLTDDARTLLDLLSSADDPLIAMGDEPSEPANATVLLGPRGEEQEGSAEDDSEAQTERQETHIALARGLAATAEGSVTIGSAATDAGLVTAIRADDAASEEVSTVDSIGQITGHLNVPLATAATISGVVDHYGSGEQASELVPEAVYLPPPAMPEDEDGNSEEDNSDDGDGGQG